MRAQVLWPTLTAYRMPRRISCFTFTSLLHRYASPPPSLNLSLRFPFFRMEVCFPLRLCFSIAISLCFCFSLFKLEIAPTGGFAQALCLSVSGDIYSDDSSDPICLENGAGSTGKKAMVENLKRFGVISSERVADVMEALDRSLFVPVGSSSAYVDTPMPIGYNATISAPHMHATCLQLLEDKLQPGMRALDVGSGTGYLTACFALMVGAEGRVVGVDHIPELVDMSIKNIEKSVAASFLKKGSLSLHVGDGRKGWPEFAPYDAIHVGAAASEIPQALLDQLKPGGRMVIPVGTYFQELKVIDKGEDGSIKSHTESSVRYVPLTSRDEQLGGF